MKTIEVPDYVADDFNRPLQYPSKAPNAVEISVERVYRLINETLKGFRGIGWDVDNGRYKSENDSDLYGLERVDDKFYVYAEERGRRSAIAIFKDDHIAAKYFVWMVSKGKCEIDWSLFLYMDRE